MNIDTTVQLIPVFWGLIALLLIAAAGILARIDPDLAEIHFGGPRLWIVSATAAAVALGSLVLGALPFGVSPPW